MMMLLLCDCCSCSSCWVTKVKVTIMNAAENPKEGRKEQWKNRTEWVYDRWSSDGGNRTQPGFVCTENKEWSCSDWFLTRNGYLNYSQKKITTISLYGLFSKTIFNDLHLVHWIEFIDEGYLGYSEMGGGAPNGNNCSCFSPVFVFMQLNFALTIYRYFVYSTLSLVFHTIFNCFSFFTNFHFTFSYKILSKNNSLFNNNFHIKKKLLEKNLIVSRVVLLRRRRRCCCSLGNEQRNIIAKIYTYTERQCWCVVY